MEFSFRVLVVFVLVIVVLLVIIALGNMWTGQSIDMINSAKDFFGGVAN